MIRKKVSISFFFSLFFGFLDTAAAAALDLGVFSFGGVGVATMSTQSTKEPEIFHSAFGAVVGVSPFRMFSVGAVGEYQSVNQTSEAKAPWGNRTGSRTALGNPYLDINMKFLRFRYVHHFFGNFKLSNPTSSGQEIVYEDPRGFRGEIHLCAIRGKERYYKLPGKCYVYAGGYYESVEFGSERVGISASPAVLSKPLHLKHYGLTLGVGF